MSSPWLMKALELPYLLRAKKVLPEADVLVTHAFWAPLLLSSQGFGKIYVHVGRYPKGQMRLYSRAERLQAPSSSVRNAILREVPGVRVTSLANLIPTMCPTSLSLLRGTIPQSPFSWTHSSEKGILELVRAGKIKSYPYARVAFENQGPLGEKHGRAGSHYLNKVKQAARETGTGGRTKLQC